MIETTSLLAAYLAFCIATASVIYMDLFKPLLKDAKALGIQNEFTQNPKLSAFVIYCSILITAPFGFLVMLIPAWSQSFKNGMEKEIMTENPDLID